MRIAIVAMIACLWLAACGGSAQIARPATDAGPFAFTPGKTYLLWHTTVATGQGTRMTWCTDKGYFYHSCRAAKNRGDVPAGISIDTANGSATGRVNLGNFGEAVVVEVTASGDFLPMVQYDGNSRSNNAWKIKRKLASVFRIEPGKVNYAGSYAGDPGFFVNGVWRPEDVRAALIQTGQPDMAAALVATMPGTATLDCSRNRCSYTTSSQPFVGFR